MMNAIRIKQNCSKLLLYQLVKPRITDKLYLVQCFDRDRTTFYRLNPQIVVVK